MSSIKRTSKRSPFLARHFLTSRTKLEGTNQEKGFSLSRLSCPTERLGAGVFIFSLQSGAVGGVVSRFADKGSPDGNPNCTYTKQ